MLKRGTNFSADQYQVSAANPKVFMAKELGMSGSEVSLGFLARGTGSSFVHQHKRNEETYLITRGNGIFHIDGEEFPVTEGSVIRVACAGKRALKADADSDLEYYCIQSDTYSLKQATRDDGTIVTHPTSWLHV